MQQIEIETISTEPGKARLTSTCHGVSSDVLATALANKLARIAWSVLVYTRRVSAQQRHDISALWFTKGRPSQAAQDGLKTIGGRLAASLVAAFTGLIFLIATETAFFGRIVWIPFNLRIPMISPGCTDLISPRIPR